MKFLQVAKKPWLRLTVNLAYAVGNCILGFWGPSWWFITMGAYYTILSVNRFAVLTIQKKAQNDPALEQFAQRLTGVLLVALSVCLLGVTILSVVQDRGRVFPFFEKCL